MKQTGVNVGEGVEKRESSCTVGGDVETCFNKLCKRTKPRSTNFHLKRIIIQDHLNVQFVLQVRWTNQPFFFFGMFYSMCLLSDWDKVFLMNLRLSSNAVIIQDTYLDFPIHIQITSHTSSLRFRGTVDNRHLFSSPVQLLPTPQGPLQARVEERNPGSVYAKQKVRSPSMKTPEMICPEF